MVVPIPEIHTVVLERGILQMVEKFTVHGSLLRFLEKHLMGDLLGQCPAGKCFFLCGSCSVLALDSHAS